MTNINQPISPVSVSLTEQQLAAQRNIFSEDPMAMFVRCTFRELIVWMNSVVSFLQANSAALTSGTMPAASTWAQAATLIQNQIANETNPNQ